MDIAKLHKHFLECTGISIDSRTIKPGQMFVALEGINFDGHAYLDEVFDKGAKYAMISDPKAAGAQTLLVDDTEASLQALANYHRKYLNLPVLAITGSNGKTTTKELLTTVLKLKFKVHATLGNYNNHLGVPLTILGTPKNTELMIVEMGANHIGEIDFLCGIAEPDYGLITNIGYAHIEGFGSYAGVLQAKTELYRFLRKKEGLIFYNPASEVLIQKLPDGARAMSYRDLLSFDESSFLLSLKEKHSMDNEFQHTQLVGNYNKTNIQAAITVGTYFNIPISDMITAICSYQPTNNRSQVIKKDNITLILDAYNANPSSMKSSISSLAQADIKEEKVLILGDMKELGEESIEMHRQVLAYAKQFQWKTIILVGETFGKAKGTTPCMHFEDIDTLSKSRAEILTMVNGAVSLIKASRSLKLERLEKLLFEV